MAARPEESQIVTGRRTFLRALSLATVAPLVGIGIGRGQDARQGAAGYWRIPATRRAVTTSRGLVRPERSFFQYDGNYVKLYYAIMLGPLGSCRDWIEAPGHIYRLRSRWRGSELQIAPPDAPSHWIQLAILRAGVFTTSNYGMTWEFVRVYDFEHLPPSEKRLVDTIVEPYDYQRTPCVRASSPESPSDQRE